MTNRELNSLINIANGYTKLMRDTITFEVAPKSNLRSSLKGNFPTIPLYPMTDEAHAIEVVDFLDQELAIQPKIRASYLRALELAYGLSDGVALNDTEIGRRQGFSRSRARQLRIMGLSVVRRYREHRFVIESPEEL